MSVTAGSVGLYGSQARLAPAALPPVSRYWAGRPPRAAHPRRFVGQPHPTLSAWRDAGSGHAEVGPSRRRTWTHAGTQMSTLVSASQSGRRIEPRRSPARALRWAIQTPAARALPPGCRSPARCCLAAKGASHRGTSRRPGARAGRSHEKAPDRRRAHNRAARPPHGRLAGRESDSVSAYRRNLGPRHSADRPRPRRRCRSASRARR